MNRFSFILLLLCVTAHASTRKCKEDVMTNQGQAPSSRAKSPDFDTSIVPTDEAELIRRINPYARTMARQNANIARMARIGIDDLHQEILSAAMIAWRKWDPKDGAGWFGWIMGGIDIQLLKLASDAKGELDLGWTHAMSELSGADMDSVPLPLANTAQKTELNPLDAKHLAEDQFVDNSPEDATILRLHVVHGKTPDEIAAQTGESTARIQRVIEHWPENPTDQMYLDRAKRQKDSFIGSSGEIQYLDVAKAMRSHYVDGMAWNNTGFGKNGLFEQRHAFRAALLEYFRKHTLRPEYDPLFWTDPEMESVITEALGRLGTETNRSILHKYFVQRMSSLAIARDLNQSDENVIGIVSRAVKLLNRHPRVVTYRNAWIEALSDELTLASILKPALAGFSDHQIAMSFYSLLEQKTTSSMASRFDTHTWTCMRTRLRVVESLNAAVADAIQKLPYPLNQATLNNADRIPNDKSTPGVSIGTIGAISENLLRGIPFGALKSTKGKNRLYFFNDLPFFASQRFGITIGEDQIEGFLRTILPQRVARYTFEQSTQWVHEFLSTPKLPRSSRQSKHLDDELIRIIQHQLGTSIVSRGKTIPKHVLFDGRLPTPLVGKAIAQTLAGRDEATTRVFVLRLIEGKSRDESIPTARAGVSDIDFSRRIVPQFFKTLSQLIEDARSRVPPENRIEVPWTDLIGLPIRNMDTIHKQSRAIFEHVFNHKTLAEAGRDSGFTRERVRQLVQAADERVAAWISANKTDLTRVTIDTSADLRSAFLIQRKKGKNLTPQAANQIDRARKYLPAHHRTLIGLQLDENKVVSEIVERFASQGKITDAATVTQDIKSAKGVLEDLLFAVKTIDTYPTGALPFSEAEAVTLIRIFREIEGSNTLPPIGELKSLLWNIETALKEMDKTPNTSQLRASFQALYRDHRSLRDLASSSVSVAQWRARQRDLIAWIKKTAKWTQPPRR